MSDILPGGSDAKKSAWNAGDPGSIPGSGRSPREGNGYPYQYSCLENPLDWSLVGYSPGVAMSRTWLSDYHTHELQHARLLCPLSSRVCSNSCSLSWSCYLIKSTSIIFPAVISHFLALCHILAIRTMFQIFSLLLYLLFWSVIGDPWCYYFKKMTTC